MMKTTKLTLEKAAVLNEVARLTAYVGAKTQTEDTGTAYARIFATDDDRELLERFWTEGCNTVIDLLKKYMLKASPHTDEVWRLDLELPGTYNRGLTPAVQSALASFMVHRLASGWFGITKKDEAEPHARAAAEHADEMMRMIYHRRPPVRVDPRKH